MQFHIVTQCGKESEVFLDLHNFNSYILKGIFLLANWEIIKEDLFKKRVHTRSLLPRLPGIALKVLQCVGG